MITEFNGQYRWLSNFHPCVIFRQGLYYPSTENAYQAAKTDNFEIAKKFQTIGPLEAKRFGKRVAIRDNWESIKKDVMYECLCLKFMHNDLRAKLLATDPQELQEGNRHRDVFWGVDLDTGAGENVLGKMLMEVRYELRYFKPIG